MHFSVKEITGNHERNKLRPKLPSDGRSSVSAGLLRERRREAIVPRPRLAAARLEAVHRVPALRVVKLGARGYRRRFKAQPPHPRPRRSNAGLEPPENDPRGGPSGAEPRPGPRRANCRDSRWLCGCVNVQMLNSVGALKYP